MNKGLIEAFTDAMVPIIVTIMVLEFKVPESADITALLHEGPYLISYMVGFLFIGVAWFNHHYMFELVKHLNLKIYWLNNVWLFTMSLIPVSAAWLGRFPTQVAPAYFYLIIFLAWTVAYYGISQALLAEIIQEQTGREHYIQSMFIYGLLKSPIFGLINILIFVAVYFWPPISITFTAVELIVVAFSIRNYNFNIQ
ncbi:TMEM175 family protein [Convivina praedatoris]|uniref:Potassium channel n=1 Tax=Convivina praedatoris TaxID=2880963 RepID=A0ABM9D3F4_9LACO|nr:TMEM175 family protein [Convivina sp. LMG 32447]CAH1852083.1 Potassium channel [Convivina sp. LMG 32447]CAH1852823.1 Potassium channel [Convivina sp. LMG 32447]